LLPWQSSWPRPDCRAIGRCLRDPGHLRAVVDDHARRRFVLAGASATRGWAEFDAHRGRVLRRENHRPMKNGLGKSITIETPARCGSVTPRTTAKVLMFSAMGVSRFGEVSHRSGTRAAGVNPARVRAAHINLTP